MSKSFTAAMKEFFGFRTGTSVTEFAKELKELSYPEKQEFHRMLVEQAGIECDPPTPPK